jgi:alpha-L-fucosidase
MRGLHQALSSRRQAQRRFPFGWRFLWLANLFFALPPIAAFAGSPNLALNKPASSSSIENDEHNAAKADDGDPATCWRADDEPEAGPEWWQVDLGKPFELSTCQIRWPYEGKSYRYKVEGSTDQETWTMLSDQTKSTVTSQVHKLKLKNAGHVRYLRIMVTGFEEGCWASICEVKVFGSERSAGVSK